MLILGESGTGKELIARAMHAESERGSRPFVAVNCSALPRELVESELFGYVAGAFTGARREGQAGKFEAAQGGTIFLDEIDSMPMEAQAKLLRVVETSEVVRLGSARPVALDVAIMAASVQDLRQRVEEGAFRLDLFHRLSVVEIVMPPLRERRGDIMLLAGVFLDKERAALGREPLAFSPEAAQRLMAYHWPGNIRELQNLCARWAMTATGPEIRSEDIPSQVRGGLGPAPEAVGRDEPPREGRRDHPPDAARNRWARGGGGAPARRQQDDDLPPHEAMALTGRWLQHALAWPFAPRSAARSSGGRRSVGRCRRAAAQAGIP